MRKFPGRIQTERKSYIHLNRQEVEKTSEKLLLLLQNVALQCLKKKIQGDSKCLPRTIWHNYNAIENRVQSAVEL